MSIGSRKSSELQLTCTKPSSPSSVRHMTPHSGKTRVILTLETNLPIGTACSSGVAVPGMTGLMSDKT